jgi:hypothetical protein
VVVTPFGIVVGYWSDATRLCSQGGQERRTDMKKTSSFVGLAHEFVELASTVFSVIRLILELVSSAINYPRRHALL